MSSSVSSTSSSSDVLRLTGMASGLDVDSMVKAMMKAENSKLDKAKQNLQRTQWKQDAYRDILGTVNTFKSSYFDVLKSDTYMLSTNGYAGFDISSVDGTSSTAVPAVTATAGADAVAGTYVVSNVTLATKATQKSGVSNVVQGDNTVTSADFTSGSTGFNIKVNGVNSTIVIDDSNYSDINSLITNINSKISASSANGVLKAQASPDGTKIQFSALTNASINISNITNGTTLSKLGFSSTSIDINQSGSDKISNLFGGTTAKFSIQNASGTTTSFSYDFSSTGTQSGWTISQVLNDIESNAGVTANYNQLSRTFSLQSTTTGSSQTIKVTADDNSFMNKIFGTTVGTAITGTDANATIKNPDGVIATVVKSKNSFNIDGVTYNLVQNNTTSNTNITVTSNTQKTYDKIKAFVDKYNDMISTISTKINETKQKDYAPLTDDQKSSMTADQITAWETKAKQGILRNDTNLDSMLNSMRTAFYTSVQGAGISLTDIGLSTSADYTQGGKIIIDETKLKDAIKNNGDQVAKLFAQSSSSQPTYSPDLTVAQRATRNSEEGIFQRVNDILKDYTRVDQRNSSGKKGIIVEIAGFKGDYSEYANSITTDITAQNKDITDLKAKLKTKETNYYNKFSKLESAMQQLNSQSSYISQMLGS